MERLRIPEKVSPATQKPRGDEQFCQQPSQQYLDLLEDAGGDPRSVSGQEALKGLERTGGWVPDFEARDARR